MYIYNKKQIFFLILAIISQLINYLHSINALKILFEMKCKHKKTLPVMAGFHCNFQLEIEN